MEKWLYVMFIERGKTYNKMTKAVVERHVENLRKLDADGKLERCGVFKGYPGVAGMVMLRAASYEEADALCKKRTFGCRRICNLFPPVFASGK